MTAIDAKLEPKSDRLSPEELEPLHQRAEAMRQSFKYAKPQNVTTAKGIVSLGKADYVRALVQVVKKDGGENNLHYHTNNDSFWLVLKGRVRFYGPNDTVIGEFGPMEGTITPQYARYWFKNVSDEDLELLHVVARANVAVKDQRVDLESQRYKIGSGQKFDAHKD